MKQISKNMLMLHFIVLIWGSTAVLGILISLPSVELVLIRTFIAASVLFFVVSYRKTSFVLQNTKTYLAILGTGSLIALHWILFFLSAQLSNAAICLSGMATCSLWTSLLEPLFKKTRIKPFEVILSLIAFLGIVIVLDAAFQKWMAFLLAVVSACVAALFTVINTKFTTQYNHFVITFYEMIGAFLATALFLPIYYTSITDKFHLTPTLSDWFYISFLAVVCTVYAYSMSVKLMKHLSAFTVNLIVNLEPLYGIVLALILFGKSEKMNINFYFGTAMLLVSVVLYPLFNQRFKKKALSTDVLR